MDFKITLFSEMEITTVVGKNEEDAIEKLKNIMYGYEIEILPDNGIILNNEEYGKQELFYVTEQGKNLTSNHIGE